MAEQLDMGRLNLNEPQHAPQQNGFGHQERSAYIPPHLRGRPGGAPPMNNGPPPMNGGPGLGGSAWGPAPGQGPPQGGYDNTNPFEGFSFANEWQSRLRRSSP